MDKKLSLYELVEQAKIASQQGLRFNIFTDIAFDKPAKSTGNVKIHATCANGTVVNFWSHRMDEVVAAIDDDGNYQVLAGIEPAKDGSLIPKTSS
jgi:hypothetical protein